MEFIEIRTQPEMEEAFEIIRELIPELDKEVFFKSHNHDLLKNHKIFGLRRIYRLQVNSKRLAGTGGKNAYFT